MQNDSIHNARELLSNSESKVTTYGEADNSQRNLFSAKKIWAVAALAAVITVSSVAGLNSTDTSQSVKWQPKEITTSKIEKTTAKNRCPEGEYVIGCRAPNIGTPG